MAVKNYSQPPYTPEQARARARAHPDNSGTGKAGGTTYGSRKAGDKMFKPGVRTGATGPEAGRNRRR
jgi:hypothetical protein